MNHPQVSENQQHDAHPDQEHTPVLIVGGGLVGLSAGLFLQRQGVPFIMIEQMDAPSILPRARGIHARSMELFRQVGLEADLQTAAKAAWKVSGFGGARRGETMLTAQPIADFRALMTTMGLETVPSPSQFCACPQTTIEETLIRPLVGRGGDIRFGHRLDHFEQDVHGVTATVMDAQGHTTCIHADYLIAADGGRGTVRRELGVASDRREALQHYVNIYFAADLTDRMEGRTFSQCEIENGQVKGLMTSVDNATRWSFHLEYDPQIIDPATFTPGDLTGFVQAALGDADVPVQIIATTSWSTVVRVARQYRDGRVFLVGDSAHVMPPWGGFGGNTGVADAHNLAWKLAAVLDGRAVDALLDSYQAERHPAGRRAGEQARLRTNFEARFQIRTPENLEIFEHLEDVNAVLMKYPYPSAGEETRPVEHLTAQLGTRFPHAWLLKAGERLSTLDLFGQAPVLLLGPTAPEEPLADSPSWAGNAHRVRLGKEVMFEESDMNWTRLTGLPDDNAVLVRPDGFVAARIDCVTR